MQKAMQELMETLINELGNNRGWRFDGKEIDSIGLVNPEETEGRVVAGITFSDDTEVFITVEDANG